ncbi:Antirestriction protein (ArdA) [Epsilonproteobacteria bacterium SCGC AD-308-E02]|jgi:antirestriction protein|nr:Antirestriction protein (ArdA) [Epsilonproteobacteria bacterium SCGC AD-308-E02]
MNNTIKIYITDLEAYNNGHLIGEWYTLPMGEDSLAECNEDVLQAGRRAMHGDNAINQPHHEETFITDWECDYMDIGEYDDIYKLNEIAEELESLSNYDIKRYTAMRGNGYSHKDALQGYEDVDLYEDMTLNDLAYMFVEQGLFGEINEGIKNYIDYDAIARDLSFDYVEVNNDIVRVA